MLSMILGMFLGILFIPVNAFSQCNTEQNELIINVLTDQYPQETSWQIIGSDGQVLFERLNYEEQETEYSDTVCLEAGCNAFTIYDTANDGLCCGFGEGAYTLILDGVTSFEGADFDGSESFYFDCALGSVCTFPIGINQGEMMSSPPGDQWFVFEPDSSGVYQIEACNNFCTATAWVYALCSDFNHEDVFDGALYATDSICLGGGGLQLYENFFVGNEYLIRLGSTDESCNGAINWSLDYHGPIMIGGGDCPAFEMDVTVEIFTDDYSQETSWEIANSTGEILASGGAYSDDFTLYIESNCLPQGECMTFTINDSFGDGICCGEGDGYYNVYVDGALVGSGGEFASLDIQAVGCEAGEACGASITTLENTAIQAELDDTWYIFEPDSSGQYSLETCNNSCATSIWVYESCSDAGATNGALYFAEDGCAESDLAALVENFEMDNTYYIRIGDVEGDCSGENIEWRISYQGPIVPTDGPVVYLENTVLVGREVTGGLEVPWEILWGPDDHIWVTEKVGRVVRVDPVSGDKEVVLDITGIVESGSEPGLLGMVLHPDFNNNPKVYLSYTYLEGGFQIKERLESYDYNGTDLFNPVTLLEGIGGAGIHDGSRLLISPDNKILMTTGDRSNGETAQDMNDLNGKILRINLDGSVPDDNPIADSYIYSYGHRNPQGLAYGPNGQLYASEHGAQQSDEFNLIESNRNYGWPTVQGECNTTAEQSFCDQFNVREPLWEWSPCVAVNGIEYYDHPGIPEWQGKMLMAVLGGFVQDPRLSILEFNADGTQVVSEQEYFSDYGRIRDVCVNPHNGAIYFATNGFNYPSSGPNTIIEYINVEYLPCVQNTNNIYTYAFDNHNYEIITENKTWADAAACAVARGGKLVEIDSQEEQDTLWYHLNQVTFNPNNTIAPGGGGNPYFWLGGNDLDEEGFWIWDGENDGEGVNFWQGQVGGSPVGQIYTNWGNEPDDAGGQDCLGIGFTGWVNGDAGEWNDITPDAEIYYIIEYPDNTVASNCDSGQVEILVKVFTDQWGYETSWSLTDQNANVLLSTDAYIYGNNQAYTHSVCVDSSMCLNFLFEDNNGDGGATYQIRKDGDIIASGGGEDFDSSIYLNFNCESDGICLNSDEIEEGTHTASGVNTWYAFKPNEIGEYRISTCEGNSCDTKIWVYDFCDGIVLSDGTQGTIYYSDNEEDCEMFANINSAVLDSAINYYIRIGGDMVDCQEQEIQFEIIRVDTTVASIESVQNIYDVKLYPNPFTDKTLLRFNNPKFKVFDLKITDSAGNLVRLIDRIDGPEVIIRRNGLPAGVYFYQLIGEKGFDQGKFVIK